jgi:hypothetical protein
MLTYDTVFPPQPAKPEKPVIRPLPLGLNDHVPAILECGRCKGDGFTLSKGFTTEDKRFPSRWLKCSSCDGAGWYHAPDLSALVRATKGRKPRSLRSKRPDETRAYYVWRLARFHGGKDTCLPMSAEMELGSDPYREILDELARIIAKGLFGSSNVGSVRWQQAMYGSHEYTDLPPVIDGPTYDSDKPLSEMLETV